MKSRWFPEVDRTDFQSIQLSRLISPVNGVRFRSGKKYFVSNAKDFHQAQYLKSLILPLKHANNNDIVVYMKKGERQNVS